MGVEDLLDLVADDVVDRLVVELARDRILDAVDQRELGVPLPRLLDRARARECGADVLSDEREQVFVVLGVADVLRVRLHDEHADRPVLRLSGTPSQVLSSVVTPSGSTSPSRDQLLVPLGRQELRLTRAKDVAGRPARVAAAERRPTGLEREIRVDVVDAIREVDELPLIVVERDVEVPRIHELPHDLVGRAIELLHVLRGARKLRDPVERALDLLRIFARHDFEYRAQPTARLGWWDG